MATLGNDGTTCDILEKLQQEYLGRSEVKSVHDSSPARENQLDISNSSSPVRENNEPVILEENSNMATERDILLSLRSMQQQCMDKVEECMSSVSTLKKEWIAWADYEQDTGEMAGDICENDTNRALSTEERRGEGVSTPLVSTSAGTAAESPIKMDEGGGKSAIQQIADSFKITEKSGPPVDKGVSDLIEGLITTRLEEKQRLDLFNKHPCPSNMEKIKPPRVNACIWTIMEQETRQRDTRAQKLQEIFLRELVPLTTAVSKLDALSKNGSPDCQSSSLSSIMGDIVEGVALIASGSYELSIKRRDAICQDIRGEYKQLCAHSNPVMEFLFGDDLQEKIKELSETNKVVERIGVQGRQSSMRGRGSPRGKGFRGRGSGAPFLEHRRGYHSNSNRYSPYPTRINNQQAYRGGGRPRRM